MRLFGSLVLWLITLVAAMFTYYGEIGRAHV
jgi:hypothetical protein